MIKDRPQGVAVRNRQRRRAAYQHSARGEQGPAGQRPASGMTPAPRLSRSPLALLEILDGLLDDGAIDPPDLVRVADDQAVVAEPIDEARDSARVRGDLGDRRIGEEP